MLWQHRHIFILILITFLFKLNFLIQEGAWFHFIIVLWYGCQMSTVSQRTAWFYVRRLYQYYRSQKWPGWFNFVKKFKSHVWRRVFLLNDFNHIIRINFQERITLKNGIKIFPGNLSVNSNFYLNGSILLTIQ